MTHIALTLVALQLAGVSISFHCARHALCIQRARINAVCAEAHVAPVLH